MMRRTLTISLIALCCSSAVWAQDGGTQSPFSFGAGARDLALGGSDEATSDVATAPFWNPSRLTAAEQMEISAFHSRLYGSEVVYQYFGLAAPTLDLGTFGFGLFRLGVDGIEERDAGNVLHGQIAENRFGLYLAYARRMAGYDLGASVALEHHALGDYRATSSPGVNIAISRRWDANSDWARHLTLALNGRNLVRPSTHLDNEEVALPHEFSGGVSLAVTPFGTTNSITILSVSVTKPEMRDAGLAMGLEYSLRSTVHLRSGYRNGDFSAGAGLNYKSARFDYALVERDLGTSHMFTITTAFGSPMSVRRERRQSRRENEFNDLMKHQLTERNQSMVSQLFTQGRESRDAGRLAEAVQRFDRALFLARSSGCDTLEISELAVRTLASLKEANRLERFSRYMDSAQVKLDAEDFLASRYFAQLARADATEPDAVDDLLDKIAIAIAGITSRGDVVREGLLEVDSLLSYGYVDLARTQAAALADFAPDDEAVRMARRRTEFEYWRKRAGSAQARGDLRSALTAVDSALALFPNHQWCIDTDAQIRDAMRQRQAQAVPDPVDAPVMAATVSPELRKEADATYQAAQAAFKRGDLHAAVEGWEQVERLIPDYQSVREYLISAYRLVGVEQYGQNELEKAVATWRKAVQLDPNNSEIVNYITRTEAELMRLKELTYEPK